MSNRIPIVILTASLLVAALTRVAAAAEGVLQIDQACVAAGCFPGDAPGFPVELDAPGSYRLTSNLVVPDADTTAILVGVNDVSIDLNGFAVLGVVACVPSGGTVSCAPAGGGRGIDAAGFDAVRLARGTVRGMGTQGVVLGESAQVDDVVVEENGHEGLTAVSGRLSGVIARRNRRSGVLGGSSARPVEIVSGVALQNGEFGYNLQMGTLHGSSAVSNGQSGVFCQVCTVTGNQIHGNGDDGIFVLSLATVRGNLITLNGGFGLSTSGSSGPTGYAENTFRSNNSGGLQVNPVGGNLIEIGLNVCQDDTTCP